MMKAHPLQYKMKVFLFAVQELLLQYSLSVKAIWRAASIHDVRVMKDYRNSKVTDIVNFLENHLELLDTPLHITCDSLVLWITIHVYRWWALVLLKHVEGVKPKVMISEYIELKLGSLVIICVVICAVVILWLKDQLRDLAWRRLLKVCEFSVLARDLNLNSLWSSIVELNVLRVWSRVCPLTNSWHFLRLNGWDYSRLPLSCPWLLALLELASALRGASDESWISNLFVREDMSVLEGLVPLL